VLVPTFAIVTKDGSVMTAPNLTVIISAIAMVDALRRTSVCASLDGRDQLALIACVRKTAVAEVCVCPPIQHTLHSTILRIITLEFTNRPTRPCIRLKDLGRTILELSMFSPQIHESTRLLLPSLISLYRGSMMSPLSQILLTQILTPLR